MEARAVRQVGQLRSDAPVSVATSRRHRLRDVSSIIEGKKRETLHEYKWGAPQRVVILFFPRNTVVEVQNSFSSAVQNELVFVEVC